MNEKEKFSKAVVEAVLEGIERGRIGIHPIMKAIEYAEENLKCCGNCDHMGFIQDIGSICTFLKQSCAYDGLCKAWKINRR